ncbi:hypothetical protein [Brevundimonas sp. Root1279]|uniref:hypothetical protein n=1 Tax=Brevundimonas sp. Root1279 TaxID=1736443 RepID=UPI0006F4A29B|nr:hypothetical protein [Brevundimonas sp. Root1279]KQW81899.1 hypothetical protein ASC65_11475 [Brevundimonas sp. Root1279]
MPVASRLGLGAVASILLVLISGPVDAQTTASPAPTDLIAALEQFCIASNGDAAKVAALADAAGFSPVPQSMAPRIRNVTGAVTFMRTNDTDMTILMAGRMNRRMDREEVTLDLCGVSVQPTDHRALDQRLRQTMGFSPMRGGGFEAYAWVQTPTGRSVPENLSDATFLAMARTGQMRMVSLDREGRGSTLLYVLPRVD